MPAAKPHSRPSSNTPTIATTHRSDHPVSAIRVGDVAICVNTAVARPDGAASRLARAAPHWRHAGLAVPAHQSGW
jgi:hypothetical protein